MSDFNRCWKNKCRSLIFRWTVPWHKTKQENYLLGSGRLVGLETPLARVLLEELVPLFKSW